MNQISKRQLLMYKRLIGYLWPHAILLVASLFCAVVYAGMNVFAMQLIRDIVTELSNKNLPYFNTHVLIAVGAYSVYLASKYSQIYMMTLLSHRIFIQIRIELYKKLQRHSMDFFSKWKLGDLVSRVFSDVEQVKMAVMLNFESLLPSSLTLIGITGYLFYINWKMALVTLIGPPFFLTIISYFSRRLKRVSKQIQEKTADITHILQENVSNIKMVQACTMEEQEVRRFEKQSQRNLMAYMKEAKLRCTQEPFVEFFQFLIFVFVIWFGGYLVVADELSGPNLLSFFLGMILLIEPVMILSKVYTRTQQSLASAERIFEILDSDISIKDVKNPLTLDKVDGALSFCEVSFAYQGTEVAALNNISVEVQSGEVVALVGLSGSGKSTFANMIPRFYDPQEGRILLDGKDIKQLRLKDLRSHIGIVPQEDILFRGTILENVRYGRLEATFAEVEEALKKANAWEFVSKFPDGMLSKIGDQGKKLSGGQRQRLSIARAILRNPKILILDEATSSLDTESERLVQSALEELMHGRTTFVIAHRLSTIVHANRILVLEKGKICESGTHAELLAKNGVYTRLYNLQFS